MPLVTINMIQGRSAETKEKLIQEVTHTVSHVVGAPVENVRVLIHEMPATHWGIAGQSMKKRRDQNK